MTRTLVRAAALAAAASLCVLGGPSTAQTVKQKQATASPAPGQQLYVEQCASCHGLKGDGEGPGAYILAQKPRNFTLGVFKFRSTPSGSPPTDEDLLRTVTHGLSGASGAMMPSFVALSEEDRRQLVAVVKRFAGIAKPVQPIVVPAEPATKNLLLGAAVYDRLQCASCHGTEGVGDGPSSTTLKDESKRRTWAPDLTRGLHKRGESSRDIFLSFATGLDGSPMPSYANKATSEELWALTHYVQSLGTKPRANSSK